MDKFVIEGGRPLEGTIKISGSKNAALPILIASLLTDDECRIENVPDLRDIRTTFRLLQHIGKKCESDKGTALINNNGQIRTDAPYDLVKQMRASALVAGPLLARFNKVRVPLPGGCAIGLRPIDIHLKGFESLGARIESDKGDLLITAQKLRGSRVKFKFPSVGATENLMMCAALAEGVTILENAAKEPEISDLAVFLRGMGAIIEGEGTRMIKICGVKSLRGIPYKVMPDRIETGTYMIACAASGGRLCLEDCLPEHLAALSKCLQKAGIKVRTGGNRIFVRAGKKRPAPVSVQTAPYPGFPTDLQAPWMAFMCRAEGRSKIREVIFENRFMHTAELARMGARINVKHNTAVTDGAPHLSGANVMASDIRAGAALVVAALSAKGVSEIQRVYHIDRGYEHIEQKLASAGARIARLQA